MLIKDFMSTDIVFIRPDTSLTQIAQEMRRHNLGSLPVCDDRGHLKGIVTDRDLVLRALAKDRKDLTADDLMTIDPVSAHPDMNIHDAALLLAAKQIRRLPVVEHKRLVGMLSLGDIASRPVYIDEAGDALSAISRVTRSAL